MIRNKYARKYCRQVKKWLPGTEKYKRQLLDSISSAVGCFVEEQPNADYIALENHFGPPQQIASDYVTEMDTGELLRNLRIKRRIVTTVTACVAAFILMWGAVGILALLDAHNAAYGFVEVEYNDGRMEVLAECEEY